MNILTDNELEKEEAVELLFTMSEGLFELSLVKFRGRNAKWMLDKLRQSFPDGLDVVHTSHFKQIRRIEAEQLKTKLPSIVLQLVCMQEHTEH